MREIQELNSDDWDAFVSYAIQDSREALLLCSGLKGSRNQVMGRHRLRRAIPRQLARRWYTRALRQRERCLSR